MYQSSEIVTAVCNVDSHKKFDGKINDTNITRHVDSQFFVAVAMEKLSTLHCIWYFIKIEDQK